MDKRLAEIWKSIVPYAKEVAEQRLMQFRRSFYDDTEYWRDLMRPDMQPIDIKYTLSTRWMTSCEGSVQQRKRILFDHRKRLFDIY